MQAEIISIGDEITSGQSLDTNSQWLSRRLEELGVRVLYHTTVADELAPNVEVFRRAIGRSDVVVATGGLGPTADDLTREALAATIGRPLVLEPRALEHVRAIFARRRREMPKQNEVQAYLPEGAAMIDNPHGTAPGIFLQVPRDARPACLLFALPGVPAEMKQMWDASVVPELRRAGAGTSIVCRRNIKCFGAGESHVESMLPDLVRRGRTPTVGITASQATIILRIAAEGESEDECRRLIEPVAQTIRECLGDLVFGEGDDELQDAVLRRLAGRGHTLATAEWGTGGLVAEWLYEADQGRGLYQGGLVTGGQVSADPAALGPTVEEAAVLCRGQFQSDVALAIGPFPAGDPETGSPPPVFVAIAGAEGTRLKSFPFAGHPALRKVLVAKQALNLLRLSL